MMPLLTQMQLVASALVFNCAGETTGGLVGLVFLLSFPSWFVFVRLQMGEKKSLEWS